MGATNAGDGGGAKASEREDGLQGVLLVDPDEAARRALARGLERGGFAVLQAADEEQARAAVAEGGIHVVVTAAPVGPYSEFQWLLRLAELWPGGLVCVLASDRRAAEMLRGGRGWRVVAKPVSAPDLADVLDTMLAGRRWSLAELRGRRAGGSSDPRP